MRRIGQSVGFLFTQDITLKIREGFGATGMDDLDFSISQLESDILHYWNDDRGFCEVFLGIKISQPHDKEYRNRSCVTGPHGDHKPQRIACYFISYFCVSLLGP